jgi:uncharacterized Zn finger protein
MTQTLAEKLEKKFGVVCPNCGRYSPKMVHASINGDYETYLERCKKCGYIRKVR